MALTITINGDDAKVAAAVPLYAKSVGWEDGQTDADGNVITALDSAKAGLMAHLRSQIQRQASQEAKIAAIQQAAATIEVGLDGITLEVTES